MKSCGFCKKPQNEVKRLISSPGDMLICEACVRTCAEALSDAEKVAPKQAKALPKPVEIKAHLDEYVIGQDTAKTDLAVAVYNHYKRRKGSLGVEVDKSNILLMGPSGCGKTHLARTLAKFLDVPFYIADASRFTQAGYVGDDVESMLQGLVADARGDLERAQWGIVFIDEFDKIARKSGRGASGYRDVSGEGVQQSLLKLIEGSVVPLPNSQARSDTLDTTNVLFIATGSFAGIEECVRKRVNTSSGLGFMAEARKSLTLTQIYEAVTEEDVLEFGIIPELVGRLPVLTSVLPLDEAAMTRVLVEPKNSIVAQMTALFALDDIELTFSSEALSWISREAIRRPTGARALRSILETALRPYAFSMPGNNTKIHVGEASNALSFSVA
jgi:ATP-dependent Clp protease ATP-binding subunit ClpX